MGRWAEAGELMHQGGWVEKMLVSLVRSFSYKGRLPWNGAFAVGWCVCRGMVRLPWGGAFAMGAILTYKSHPNL